MKKLIVLAALFMATTSAHAGNGISFEIDGQKIRIEAPRNCDSLSCIKISAPGFKGFKSNHSDDDDDAVSNPPPAKSAPAPAPVQATAPRPVAPVTTNAAPAPAQMNVATAAPAINDVAPSAQAPVAVTAPASQPAPVAAAPAAAPTTPLGIWATEENKGNVRIEECGTNLCGYAVKTGEKILISMKPEGSKWRGRIHDPDSGHDYDSTIAMKGTNTLRVQGCAFGGMFCGGQTWKRVS
jgi:uncharacterized protein (DUF2147 family)